MNGSSGKKGRLIITRLLHGLYWAGLLAGTTLATLRLIDTGVVIDVGPFIVLQGLILALGLITVTLYGPFHRLRRALQWPGQRLRSRPALLWLLILAGVLFALIEWEVVPAYASVYHRNLYAWVYLWGGALLLFGGATIDDWRAAGRRLQASRWTGLLITLTTIIIILIGVELALRHSLYFTNTYARGLIHRRWDQDYWKPLNSLRFRDYPIEIDSTGDDKQILVLGDSFAAGFGIEDIEDTFHRRLANMLGDGYEVHLVAHAGWNTNSQLEGLQTYPIKPDIVIWSYYLNDISYLGSEYLSDWYAITTPPPPILYDLVERFYLPNFLYWNVYTQMIKGGGFTYNNTTMRIYQDPVYWDQHKADMQAILDWIDTQNTEVIALIWPVLPMVEESKLLTQQIQGFFDLQTVPMVNLAGVLDEYSPGELIVNLFDIHANEFTHGIAAEQLYQKFQELGLAP